MKATNETRQRMLLAATGLLTPVVMFLAWGLFDRFAPRPQPSQLDFRRDAMTREESFKYGQLRATLLEAARRRDWGKVLLKAGEVCGSECPSRIANLQAEAHWRTGQRQKAAQLWEPFLNSSSVAFQADFLALRGDLSGYKQYVSSLVPDPDPHRVNDTAWAAVLLPRVLESYAGSVELAQKAVEAARTTPETQQELGNALNTLGVALYRAGRYDEARARLDESQKSTPEMANTVFLALCYHQRKDGKKAQELADTYYQYLYDSLPEDNRTRPEYLLFEQELRAVVPPSKKVKTL